MRPDFKSQAIDPTLSTEKNPEEKDSAATDRQTMATDLTLEKSYSDAGAESYDSMTAYCATGRATSLHDFRDFFPEVEPPTYETDGIEPKRSNWGLSKAQIAKLFEFVILKEEIVPDGKDKFQVAFEELYLTHEKHLTICREEPVNLKAEQVHQLSYYACLHASTEYRWQLEDWTHDQHCLFRNLVVSHRNRLVAKKTMEFARKHGLKS